jgi:hypothetical protein
VFLSVQRVSPLKIMYEGIEICRGFYKGNWVLCFLICVRDGFQYIIVYKHVHNLINVKFMCGTLIQCLIKCAKIILKIMMLVAQHRFNIYMYIYIYLFIYIYVLSIHTHDMFRSYNLQARYIARTVVQGKLHAFLRDLTSVGYNQVLLNKIIPCACQYTLNKNCTR